MEMLGAELSLPCLSPCWFFLPIPPAVVELAEMVCAIGIDVTEENYLLRKTGEYVLERTTFQIQTYFNLSL